MVAAILCAFLLDMFLSAWIDAVMYQDRLCWQGLLQCCVTGPAFEQMLLQADGSVVQAIMSSLVVCARMQGQQKGQVIDLLSQRGLHQTLQGEQCHLMVSIDWLSYLSIVVGDRLLWKDKTCPVHTYLMSWKAILFIITIIIDSSCCFCAPACT